MTERLTDEQIAMFTRRVGNEAGHYEDRDDYYIGCLAREVQQWRALSTGISRVLKEGVLPLLDETNGPTVMAKITLEVVIEQLREALL